MKDFTKKGFVRKIFIILTFLVVFNFIYPYMPVSFAKDVEEQNEEIQGGILLNPVLSLVTAIGDGVMNAMQKFLLGMNSSFYHVNNSSGALAVLAGVVAGGASVILRTIRMGWWSSSRSSNKRIYRRYVTKGI